MDPARDTIAGRGQRLFDRAPRHRSDPLDIRLQEEESDSGRPKPSGLAAVDSKESSVEASRWLRESELAAQSELKPESKEDARSERGERHGF